MQRFPFIEFARGYAIFTIVCYHVLQRIDLGPMAKKAIVFGGTGVHLFFLLSGFGLAASAKKGFSVGDFFRKRFSKIWLPYVLAISISLAAAFLFGIFPDRWAAWTAGVGLFQMFSEGWIESFGGHFWFISTIVQFYIAFPVLLFLKKKVGAWPFFWLCLAVSVGWWLTVFALGMGEMRVWNSFFLQFLWEFSLGMLLADFDFSSSKTEKIEAEKRTQKAELHLPATAFSAQRGSFLGGDSARFVVGGDANNGLLIVGSLVAGLVFTAIMVVMVVKMGAVGKIFNDVPALIGYSSLAFFLFRFSELFLPFVERFFRWVAGFGYSLYLVHILVLEIWLRLGGLLGFEKKVVWLVAFLPIGLLAGWVFEKISGRWVRLFEPFLNRKKAKTESSF